MPTPENILTTAPAPSPYAGMSNADLAAEAEARGLNLGYGYVTNPTYIAALEADDREKAEAEGEKAGPPEPGTDLHATSEFIAPGQPAHRYDVNQPVEFTPEVGVVYVARADLQKMSRGETVEIDGVKLAADPRDFPP